jgi:hypothetical protein
MNDDQFFLANAYLDGELTDAERAIADADPTVMAAVEELRALQRTLRDVEPASDSTRDAAIAAAMAEFTRPTAVPADRPPAPAPIPFRPRPAYAKYLAVAAGVLGVGMLGVAVANLDTGGGDDSADTAAEEPASEPAAASEESRLTEDADVFADEPTAEMATEMAADEPSMDMADEPADQPAEEPAEEPADEPADEPASGPDEGSGAGFGERPDLVADQVLTTPEELGSFGTGLFEQQQTGAITTPNTACPIENVLGRAQYLGDSGTIVEILVAVDEPAEIVLAFEDGTCEFLLFGPLYLD